MGLEDIKIGDVVQVQSGKDPVESMVFEGVIGSSCAFLKEQEEGVYIISSKVKKKKITSDGNVLRWDSIHVNPVVYKPSDFCYEDSKRVLESADLLWGGRK